MRACPEGPTASASRKARSPLPQHTSSTAFPAAAPLHLTAMRFHTRCCPRLSRSLKRSYTGAMRPKSCCRAADSRPSVKASAVLGRASAWEPAEWQCSLLQEHL